MTFDQIVRAGWIKPAWETPPRCPAWFHARELDEWLGALCHNAPMVCSRPVGTLTIDEATKVTRRTSFELIGDLLSGAIKAEACLNGPLGLRGLLVPESALTRWSMTPPPGMMRKDEVERKLGIGPITLKVLRKKGFVSGQLDRGIVVFTKAEVDRAALTLVTDAELARRTRTGIADLRARLRSAGIRPVVAGAEQVFDRNNALKAIDMGAPDTRSETARRNF